MRSDFFATEAFFCDHGRHPLSGTVARSGGIRVVAPRIMSSGTPYCSGIESNTTRPIHTLSPGINGPTSRAAIKNADDNLKQLRQALDDLGLAATTDLIIAADHGFATVSKERVTSLAPKISHADVSLGFLPRGFLAIDLATALDLPLFD